MLGTFVNAAAVIIGGLLGQLLRGRLKERVSETVMQGISLAVVFLGLSNTVEAFAGGEVETLLFILSLALGGLIGAAVNIDLRFNTFASFAERKMGKGNLSKGFVAGSILYCVGTMAVIGSIESGALGKHDTLYAKSMLDGITAIILGVTLGPGIILSALSVIIYQGAISLAAGFLSPWITDLMLVHIQAVGGVLIFAIGLNLLNITKFKLMNFLPAVFIPVVYYAVMGLV